MTRSFRLEILTLFFLGWVTFAFSLFNAGRFSITLLLVASSVLAVSGFSLRTLSSLPTLSLLTSGVLALLVALVTQSADQKTFTHLFQYLLAIGVMIAAKTTEWDSVLPRFHKALLWIAGLVFLYSAYQFVARKEGLPFAFLPVTNLQVGGDLDGLQRGSMNFARGVSIFTRVSSFFAEPSDLGRFMLWVFAVGYASAKGRFRLPLMAMGVAGILISQSLGGVAGLVVLVTVVSLVRRNFRKVFVLLFVGAVVLSGLIRFFPEAFDTIANRAEEFQTGREDRVLQEQRFADASDNIRVALEAPMLGHGLSSVVKVIPNNIVSSAWEMLLVERGILGTLLFLVPFFVAFAQLSIAKGTSNEIRDTALMVLVVEMYCFLSFSALYFQSAYLALGFALYACERVHASETTPHLGAGHAHPVVPV